MDLRMRLLHIGYINGDISDWQPPCPVRYASGIGFLTEVRTQSSESRDRKFLPRLYFSPDMIFPPWNWGHGPIPPLGPVNVFHSTDDYHTSVL